MTAYRKRPVAVEAVQWTGSNLDAMPYAARRFSRADKTALEVFTTDGFRAARVGDWIVTGENGDVRVCTAEAFEKMYEAVSEEAKV